MRFEESGKFDVNYLYRLSADAIPDIIEIRDSEIALSGDIYSLLKSKYNNIYDPLDDESWFSYNYPRYKAKALLENNLNL